MARSCTTGAYSLKAADPVWLRALTSFTWSIWITPTARQGMLGRAICVSKGTTILQYLQIFSSGALQGGVSRSDGSDTASKTGALTFGESLRIAMTYSEANRVQLYRDGVNVQATQGTVRSGATVQPGEGCEMNVGNCYNLTTGLYGAFAEIGIWNRILSSEELLLLGQAAWTPRLIPTGLVATWKLLGDSLPEIDEINGTELNGSGFAQSSHPYARTAYANIEER